ncbi:hypothetical protein [Novosphingobium sp.]|uniref:hypothetical protein n=1 Tax=Novosphingobium sp. TaxID=1874826 RepID=UPI002633E0AF|nr:hypothetical protein [Novosphingobium sp.]
MRKLHDASALLELSINGTAPFLSHRDALGDHIRQAHALALVFESAFRTASELQEKHPGHTVDTIEGLNPTIIGDALQGLQTLLAMAQFHADQGRA